MTCEIDDHPTGAIPAVGIYRNDSAKLNEWLDNYLKPWLPNWVLALINHFRK